MERDRRPLRAALRDLLTWAQLHHPGVFNPCEGACIDVAGIAVNPWIVARETLARLETEEG